MASWVLQLEQIVPLEAICRLSIAIASGAIIGWEREKRDKPAGLRTHMLVALGAAVFMIGAMDLSVGLRSDDPAIRLDPTRALAGIIGGVGFLGAGTIIESRGSVHGITTAASIWVSAAIGTCCGMGLYRLAVTCALFTLLVLWAVGRLERSVLQTKGSKSPSRRHDA